MKNKDIIKYRIINEDIKISTQSFLKIVKTLYTEELSTRTIMVGESRPAIVSESRNAEVSTVNIQVPKAEPEVEVTTPKEPTPSQVIERPYWKTMLYGATIIAGLVVFHEVVLRRKKLF